MKFRNTVAAVLLLAGFSFAQSTPSPGVRGVRQDTEQQSAVFLNYMYTRSDFPSPSIMQSYKWGGAAQADMMFKQHIGLALDFSMSSCAWCVQTNKNSNQWSFLVGPRFQYGSGKSKFGVTPWVGFGKLTYENPPNFPHVHESGAAYGVGGDWNLRLSSRFSYRVIGADYLRMPYKEGANGANWIRITTGLGIKF
jgi:hypothetical protein